MAKDINELMAEKTKEYLDSKDFEAVIESKIKTMIDNSVTEALGYNSSIRKTVDEAIKGQMLINEDDLKIGSHITFINEMITKRLKKVLRTESQEKIQTMLDSCLDIQEKVVSFEDFEKKVFELCVEEKGGSCICDGELEYHRENTPLDEVATLVIEEPGGDYDWFTIYLDGKPDVNNHSCEYELTVHKNNTRFKLRDRDLRAHDVILDYQFDLEDYIYSLFLNGSQLDYETVKEAFKNR